MGETTTAVPNEARISLVIDAPDQKQFGGIDAAAERLKALQDQLAATNTAMGDLGFKKFDTKSFTDLNKAVDDGIKKIQASADAIAKQTQAATSAAQSQTKLTESTVNLQQATAGSMQASQLNEQGIWKTTRAMDEWGKSTLKSVNEGEKWTQSNRMQATALAKVTTAITESVTAAKTKTAESLKLENEPARLLEQAKAWREVAKSTRMAVDADGGQLSRPQRASFALKESEANLNAAKLETKAQAVRRAEIEKTFTSDDKAKKQQAIEESALRTQLDAAAKHQIESSKLVRDAQIADAKAVAKQRKALLGKDQKEDRAHHEVVAAKSKVEAASTHEDTVRSSATSMSQFAGVDMLAINKALGEASNAKKNAQGELADAERRMFDATEARQQADIKATTAAQKAAEDDAYKRNVEENRRKISDETAAREAAAKDASSRETARANDDWHRASAIEKKRLSESTALWTDKEQRENVARDKQMKRENHSEAEIAEAAKKRDQSRIAEQIADNKRRYNLEQDSANRAKARDEAAAKERAERNKIATTDDTRKRIFEEERAAKDAADKSKKLIEDEKARAQVVSVARQAADKKAREMAKGFAAIEKGQAASAPPESERGIVGGRAAVRDATKQAQQRLRDWMKQISEAGKHELDVAKRVRDEKLNFANLVAEDSKKKFGPGQKDEIAKVEMAREREKLDILKEYQATANRLLGQAQTARIKQRPFRVAADRADGFVAKGETSVAAYEGHVQAATSARIAVDEHAMRERINSDAVLRLKKDLADAETFKQQRLSQRTASPNQHTEKEERQRIEAAYKGRKGVAYRRAKQSTTAVDPQVAAGHALNASKAYTGMVGALHHATVASDKFNDSTHLIGKNMLQNIAHVTAWSASVGVLYGSLRVLKESVGALVELQYQQARLSVVMGLSQSETTGLTDEILRLAAANGRSGDDAMRAATQWARLGMTKRQVAEATRVSLVAANVAETTAAEATESLSAIMVTYGLHAGQLNGVLGMLNQTSNTYNVTVGELLNGLERVSSVAKQAGLSLAETQGIIGAAAGATGQTGANIGNSLKSFIGAVSGEEGQKNLRSFGIETTSGGEVKDMTRIVNELYVAYQRMSEAERRTMIFSTVGKNQASRVTAMLDNYVKSQVLAVNSLNNLNSAGKENEVILATMKSQLQGVITEWQRFVALQSKNIAITSTAGFGPNSKHEGSSPLLKHGGPLGQSMSAISNIGKLANTGFGSVAATAGIGMMIAGLMRMALVQHQVGMATAGLAGKNNILVSTSRAVTGTLHGMKEALYSAAAGMGSAMTASTAMAGGLTRAQQSLLLLKGAAATVFSPANFKMAGWMAALVVVGEVINRIADHAKEATGNNSDEIASDAEKVGQAAETTSRAAEGYSIAARLFQTSRDAMEEASKVPGRQNSTMDQILKQVRGLDTSLPGVEGRLKEAAGSAASFMSALEAEKINAISHQYIKQADAIRQINEQVAMLQQKSDELNASKPLGMSIDEWTKKRAEMEGKLSEAKGSKVKVVSSAANQMKQDIAEQFNTSVVGLRFLDHQKMVLSEISNLYKEIGANSDHSTQQDLEVHRLRVVADLNKRIVESLSKQRSDILNAPNSPVTPEAIEARKQAKLGPLVDRRAILQKEMDTILGGGGSTVNPRVLELEKQIVLIDEAKTKAATLLATENEAIENKTGFNRISHALTKATPEQIKSEAEAQAAEAAAKSRIAADSARFRYTALAGTERARVDASGVGDDEFGKWSAKKKYLDDQRRLFEAKGGNASQDDKLQQLEREKMDMGMIKDAAVQKEVLDGKINQHLRDRTKEYRKQLMMMGPGELLSQLAMQKLAPGMTGGQLLSAAPNMRKMYMDMPGNDDQTREMQRAADGFASLKLNAEKVGKAMDDTADRIRLLLPAADNVVKPTLESLPGDLVNALSKVDKLNVNAANVVVNQGAANPDFIGPVAGARASGGPVEKGRTYLVGEKGPETFVPKQDGQILAAGSIAGAAARKGMMDTAESGKRYFRSGISERGASKIAHFGQSAAEMINDSKFAAKALGGGAGAVGGRIGAHFAGPVGLAAALGMDAYIIGKAGYETFDTFRAIGDMRQSMVDGKGADNILAVLNEKRQAKAARDAADRIPVPEAPVGFDALESPSGMFENNPSNYDQNRGGAISYSGGGATDIDQLERSYQNGRHSLTPSLFTPGRTLKKSIFDYDEQEKMAEEKARPKYQTQLKPGEISHPSGALPNRQSIQDVNRFPIVSQDFQHPDWKTPEQEPASSDFESGGDDSHQTVANADARRKPQNMSRQSRAYRPTQTIRPYATVAQPGRQPGRTQQAQPRAPIAGNIPVDGAPAQGGQAGNFPTVMSAAAAVVANFSGAVSAATANLGLMSTAITQMIANMAPKTAFAGAPANADNPFS